MCAGSTAAASSAASWPADFPWRLAEAALAFLAALGGIGEHGKLWLVAACTSLHKAMLTSPAHSRPLRYRNDCLEHVGSVVAGLVAEPGHASQPYPLKTPQVHKRQP